MTGSNASLRFSLIALLFMGLPVLPVWALAVLDAPTPSPSPFAFVQLIHNVPDAGPVDVYVDDEKVLDDFAFQTATPFVPVVRGYRAVSVVPGDAEDNSSPVWADTLLLEPDAYYTAIAIGQVSKATLDVLVLDQIRLAARVESQVEYLLVHGVPDVEVDIRLLDRDDRVTVQHLLVNNFGFGDVVGYWRLDPADHIVQVLDAPAATPDTTELAVLRVDVSPYEGQTVTLLTSPLTDSTFTLIGFDANGTLISGEALSRTVNGAGPLVLDGNYPNPFNPATTVRFDLAEPARVHLDIIDLLGRRVMTLPTRPLGAGTGHTFRVDAAPLASGTYLYRVIAQTETRILVQSGHMVLAR